MEKSAAMLGFSLQEYVKLFIRRTLHVRDPYLFAYGAYQAATANEQVAITNLMRAAKSFATRFDRMQKVVILSSAAKNKPTIVAALFDISDGPLFLPTFIQV